MGIIASNDVIVPAHWDDRCEWVERQRATYERNLSGWLEDCRRWGMASDYQKSDHEAAKSDRAMQRVHYNSGPRRRVCIPAPDAYYAHPRLGDIDSRPRNKQALYEVLDGVSGCYVGFDDVRCLYVGMSTNLAQRLVGHSTTVESHMAMATSIFIYRIDDWRALEVVEQRLIRYHNPYWNWIRKISDCAKSWWSLDDSALTESTPEAWVHYPKVFA